MSYITCVATGMPRMYMENGHVVWVVKGGNLLKKKIWLGRCDVSVLM